MTILKIIGMALVGGALGAVASPTFGVLSAIVWGLGGYYVFVREEMP